MYFCLSAQKTAYFIDLKFVYLHVASYFRTNFIMNEQSINYILTDHLLPDAAANCTTPPQGMLGLVHHQITLELEQTP